MEQTELQRALAETTAIVEEEAKQSNGVDDPWKFSSEVEFVPNSQVEQVSDTPIIEASSELEQTDSNIDISEYEGLESYINKEISPEEIEKLKQEANAAIYLYQQYGETHFRHTRNQATQEEYRKREQIAWDAIDKLAYTKGGKILTLPHQRDIELAHPEQIDLGEKLENLGYKFNQNGEITHIQLNGNTIELDRPRSVTELLKGKRPAHIVYGYGESLVTDNDENKYYTGYIVQGLNPQTPDYIIGKLSDKKFLESVIIDPWETPIEHILPEQEKPLEASSDKSTPLLAPDIESRRDNNKDFADLRVQYAKAEEFYNKNRSDENAKSELERLREEYNKTVEKTFGIMAAEGLELEIHKAFVQEVKNLRDERILQSQELQSGFEKVINPLKEKFVNFAIKHKKIIGRLNLVALGVGTTLALTGVGLPVAGGLAVLRRSVGGLMSGVSSRELARAGFEDGDINLFKGKIKWQAAIPKLVGESLQEGYIKGAKDADLSTKLSTLEAYYRLNGGKFTNESQQTAYESILNELGSRVQQENIINQSEKEVNPTTTQEVKDETINSEISNSDEGEVKAQPEKFVFSSPEQNQQYTSKLLTVLSEKRITELQKQQQKRKTADIIGFVAGGSLLTIGTLLDANRANLASQNTIETAPPAPDLPTPEELDSGKGIAKEVTQNLSAEQIKDISELSSGETLIGEITKKLGANATEEQIQQGLETYMHTSQGSETIFNLASQTEAGKALLGQLGVDNAGELSQLSNTDLYEITRHLGTGPLQGLDSLDLQNITASSVSSPIEVVSVTTATPEQLLSKFTQAPDILDFPEGAKPLTQINNYIDRFAGDLPHDSSLGQEVLTTYLNTPEGKDWLYDAIVNNPERLSGNQNIQFVEEYFRQKGIKSGADIDWVNLTQDKRFPTSMFWRETSLTGGRKIPPLSTLLKPGTMPGIKKALEQVLTLKQ